ncbi:MAG: TrmH family RNA methyltransferase [Bacteroidota bacterium]
MNRKKRLEELGRLSVTDFQEAPKTPLIVVLDDVRSALNVGSVFRTADAFRLEAVYLCGITATPPNNDIRKTALGASESVTWRQFASALDAVEELQKDGVPVVAVEQAEQTVSLPDFVPEPNARYALVFGNEVNGVAQEVVDQADTCLEIPQFGTKHSLNISISVGIVVWDVWSKWAAVR